jgi:hypothetical protein
MPPQAALDVKCLALPGLVSDRCPGVRGVNGVVPGANSSCWVAGSEALYAGGLLSPEILGNVTAETAVRSPIVGSAARRVAPGVAAAALTLAAALWGV